MTDMGPRQAADYLTCPPLSLKAFLAMSSGSLGRPTTALA